MLLLYQLLSKLLLLLLILCILPEKEQIWVPLLKNKWRWGCGRDGTPPLWSRSGRRRPRPRPRTGPTLGKLWCWLRLPGLVRLPLRRSFLMKMQGEKAFKKYSCQSNKYNITPHQLYLPHRHNHPPQLHSKTLVPHCSPASWWLQQRIHNPTQSLDADFFVSHDCIKYCPSSTHMLIVTGKKMAEFTIPLSSPEFAVVIHLAELGAPFKAGLLCVPA